MVSKDDVVELRIEGSAFEGKSVGRIGGMVVFVPFAVPGDRVRVRVVRKRSRYAEATIEEVLEPSTRRVAPRCRYFGTCGGCRLQNLVYEEQLAIKREQVRDLFERIGGLRSVRVEPTLPSPDIYFYRNKMEFSFGNSRWLTREEIASGAPLGKDFALGLHIPKRFDKILDLEECFLQGETSVRIVNRVRRLALELDWAPYDTRGHRGYLRNLVIRTGKYTGETMVVAVTTSSEPERMRVLADALTEEIPAITTVVNAVNRGRSPVAAGEEEFTYHGDGVIHERIGSLVFRVGPTAFFQPNSSQTPQLLETIRDFSQPAAHQLVYDLYCGLGSIGLFLAPLVRSVIGVETHAEAVRLGSINAELNQIGNCSFQTGDAIEALKPDFVRRNGRPDLLILDPPRAGLHPDLIPGILRVKPTRIVYTSCNPATQARDLKLLSGVYQVEAVQPVDMFPQTYHIECVVALALRSSRLPSA
jgi:23S rRNA (uracil1939-C5)-methyltransferase